VKGFFGKVTNAQSTYLNYHRELSDRMIDTLRSRLDAGQLRALRLENPGEKFDLGRIVNELMKRTSLFAKARQVKLSSEIPPGLPKVLGDPRKLSLAFESVFLVAIEASPKGSTISIALSKELLDQRLLRLSVSCKVPARHVERMVDILGQPIEDFEDAFKDMKIEDLRLLLSRWTIELHGGAASQELGKKGTISMIFDLPIAPAA
jgi:signal transduction histidine kinase